MSSAPVTVQEFDEAIDVLERGLRDCPDDLWEAPMWEVKTTDAWIWPSDGSEPEPERTFESTQVFSSVWLIAYHCLWYLDFYLTTGTGGYESPAYVRGGPEEQGINEHGAAVLPDRVYPPDVLLRFLEHGRRRVHEVLPMLTDDALDERCPDWHPWAGTTLRELLRVNLKHVREHGGQIRDFLAPAPTPSAQADDPRQSRLF